MARPMPRFPPVIRTLRPVVGVSDMVGLRDSAAGQRRAGGWIFLPPILAPGAAPFGRLLPMVRELK